MTAAAQASAANGQQQRQHKDKNLPLAHKLVVGGAAGVVGTTAIFPIDMVKTRSQSSSKLYNGPVHAARMIFAKEGIAGFYRGLVPNLIGVTPEKAIKLAANDLFREFFEKPDGSIAFHHELLSGAGAGACQVVATTPMELIKIRMQMQKTLPVEQQQTTLQVVRSLGIRGAYTGMTATLIRDVPFSIIFFPAYANLKTVFADSNGHNSLSSLLTAGGIAGAVGAFLATPMDVVKTRLQEAGGAGRYTGIPDCFSKIYRQEGVQAFFKGAVPRMCVVAPLFGISLLAFEKQKEYLLKTGRL